MSNWGTWRLALIVHIKYQESFESKVSAVIIDRKTKSIEQLHFREWGLRNRKMNERQHDLVEGFLPINFRYLKRRLLGSLKG